MDTPGRGSDPRPGVSCWDTSIRRSIALTEDSPSLHPPGARPSPEVIREFPDRGTLWLLEDPSFVRDLLSLLDSALPGQLDFERAVRVNRSFIPADLQKQESDLIFRVPCSGDFATITGPEIWIYILVEHQSSPDRELLLRFLLYMTQLWETQRRTFVDAGIPKGERRYLPVVPILFYTGDESWTVPESLARQMEAPTDLGRFVPAWETLVLNLNEASPDELVQFSSAIGWVLRVLQQERSSFAELRRAINEALIGLEGLPSQRPGQWLRAVWYLVLLAFHRREAQEYNELSRQIRDWSGQSKFQDRKEAEHMAMTMAQECEARGEARGEVRGLSKALISVLSTRFGTVPPEIQLAVERANGEMLQRWIVAAASASTLDGVGIQPTSSSSRQPD